ncbi:hypothetical protein VCHC47A1_0246, partial [Vibrio cholerae HC-47A1]
MHQPIGNRGALRVS